MYRAAYHAQSCPPCTELPTMHRTLLMRQLQQLNHGLPLHQSAPQGPQTRALKREAAEVFLQIQAPSEAQREDHKLRAARGHQLIAVESGDLGCAQCGATGVAATAATGAAAAIAAACRQGPAALHPGSLVWVFRPLLLALDRLKQRCL
eukprot:781412-Pelagomonas_calceolata.AAC.2